ncbi:MAG: ion transporter [bacterium]
MPKSEKRLPPQLSFADSAVEQPLTTDSPLIRKLKLILQGHIFQYSILILILFNAITLGMETFPSIQESFGQQIQWIDQILLFIFVAELCVRVGVYRKKFFNSGWNIFDFIIITISALSMSPLFAALRAFRVLRLLHIVTVMPRMRVVVSALIDSIPGILSVGVVVVLVLYVFAIIASNLYGATNPEHFGNIFITMYTLFQVMTLEGWVEIAADVSSYHQYSWIFFIAFVLVGTFTMLNLFVAIIVRVVEEDSQETEELLVSESDQLKQEIQYLRQELKKVAQMLAEQASISPRAENEESTDES